MDRWILPQHQLPPEQERNLEREDCRPGASHGEIWGDQRPGHNRHGESPPAQGDMVDGLIDMHLQNYKSSGAELIMGSGRFVAPKTLEVQLNDGGTRLLGGAE